MNFNKEDLNTIRSKVDILEFLESRGNSFRQSGTSWVGLCPVHSERSPSFNVKPSTQTFRCYGCGISGDIFSLVQEIESLSFPGAVQFLADHAGVKLSIEEDPSYKRRQRLLTVVRLTAEWFRHNYTIIPQDHPAKQELAKRNLYEFSISDTSVGFAPSGGLLKLLLAKGFSEDELVDAGVYIRTDKGTLRDRFRNRLVWTIYTPQGQPIGFSARKIFENDNGPKYINSPQTELFNKSKTLLGIQEAKRSIAQTQQVYIVEGQTDVMALRASGKTATVASCGTAFGLEHVDLLMHLSKLGKHAEHFEMVFCFDGDAAGVKAATKVFETIPQLHLNASVVKFLDNGEPTDPCDFRISHGDLALIEFIDKNRVPLIEFVLSENRKKWNLDTPEGKSNYVTEARKLLSLVTDKIQYAAYVRKVAAWTGLSYIDLTSDMRQNASSQPVEQKTEITTGLENLNPTVVTALATIVQYPTESMDVLNSMGVDSTYFLESKQLAAMLMENAMEGVFDYENETAINLSHYDLNIADSRKETSVQIIFKNFLKHQYVTESSKLDALLMEPGVDPVAAFQSIIDQQEKLKIKFKQ